jgi:hypothetical protein
MDYENGWGTMPDGEVEQFSSESEYEDAFFDRIYEMNNGFEFDGPEDWAA